MNIFKKYDESTAPAASATVLNAIKERYGFVPNLAAYIAESPVVLDAVLNLSKQFDQSSLSSKEQQLVLLTVSTLNGCSYCKAAHSALGKMTGLESETLQAISMHLPLEDARLEALRTFTRDVFEDRGWVGETKVRAFLDAGFTRAQVFEVVMGVALKTMTNYCNHLAGAEPNVEFINMAGDSLAA